MKRLALILSFIFFALGLEAGKETRNQRISGAAMVSGANVFASDDKYPNCEVPGQSVVLASKGKITFGINEYSPSYITGFPSNGITVVLNVTAYDKLTNMITVSNPVRLTLSFNNSGEYTDKNIFSLPGSHLIGATIVQFEDPVTSAVIPAASVPQNLFLETEVETDRYYAFNFNYFASNPGYVVANNYLSASDELEIHWQNIPGAEEYELEWTYINDYDGAGNYYSVTGLPSGFPFSFRDNTTRVQVTGLSYKISLIFEHGYILYRVRGIGRDIVSPYTPIPGTWSADPNTLVSVNLQNHLTTYPTQFFINSGVSNLAHETNKNWQYSASYAEDGKKKEVVSYFDGSLHNRQSVTKINSTENVVVGETFYDHQGRPVIQVMPAPSLSSIIKFTPGFNQLNSACPFFRLFNIIVVIIKFGVRGCLPGQPECINYIIFTKLLQENRFSQAAIFIQCFINNVPGIYFTIVSRGKGADMVGKIHS